MEIYSFAFKFVYIIDWYLVNYKQILTWKTLFGHTTNILTSCQMLFCFRSPPPPLTYHFYIFDYLTGGLLKISRVICHLMSLNQNPFVHKGLLYAVWFLIQFSSCLTLLIPTLLKVRIDSPLQFCFSLYTWQAQCCRGPAIVTTIQHTTPHSRPAERTRILALYDFWFCWKCIQIRWSILDFAPAEWKFGNIWMHFMREVNWIKK